MYLVTLRCHGMVSHRPHHVIPLEGDPARLGVRTAQLVYHLVPEQRSVAQVLVDGVGGHLGDVLRRLGLNVERDEAVRHQVVHRLKPLLPYKVLAIVEKAVVQGLVSEPGTTTTTRSCCVMMVVDYRGASTGKYTV